MMWNNFIVPPVHLDKTYTNSLLLRAFGFRFPCCLRITASTFLQNLHTCYLTLGTKFRSNYESMPHEVLTTRFEIPVEDLFWGPIRDPPFANFPCNCVDFDFADMSLGNKSVRNNALFRTLCFAARADVESALTGAHDSSWFR